MFLQPNTEVKSVTIFENSFKIQMVQQQKYNCMVFTLFLFKIVFQALIFLNHLLVLFKKILLNRYKKLYYNKVEATGNESLTALCQV